MNTEWLAGAIASLTLGWATTASSASVVTFDEVALDTVVGSFVVAEAPDGGRALFGDLDTFKFSPVPIGHLIGLVPDDDPLPTLPENHVYVVTSFDIYFPADNFGGPHGPRIVFSGGGWKPGVVFPTPDEWLTVETGSLSHPTVATVRAGQGIYLDNFVIETADFSAFIPEPSTWALMIGGMGLTGVALRRKFTAQSTRGGPRPLEGRAGRS